MTIFRFSQITKENSQLGGKGFALGLMKNANFPVPDGLILSELPTAKEDWDEIVNWWINNGSPKIAVRSSAVGEDSNEQSFAGQNSSYLNVQSVPEIKNTVSKCFLSMHKKSSTLYREHFVKENSQNATMNVVLQIMVEPKFSGVFFSVDPRTNQPGWIVEAIEGLGEDLVSGKTTPLHFEEKHFSKTDLFDLENLIKIGMKVRDFFGLEIDMEWAIDQNNALKVLQARPITALAGKSEEKRMIDEELKRLRLANHQQAIWDGSTFAEWNGSPSELTFSIWSAAFSKDQAFSKALAKLGYLGIQDEIKNETHSLLEKIFDRAYINISMMAPMYFGPIPYRLEYNQRPQLKFDFSRLDLKTILLTPITISRMIKVSYRLSTERQKWLSDCTKELVNFNEFAFNFKEIKNLESISNTELFSAFKNEVNAFHNEHLVWPLLLITLIESTSQGLKAYLKGVVPENQIEQKINQWLSIGIHTVTMDMNNEYREAANNEDKREYFLQCFGHRGPGELELSNPRWFELKQSAFYKISTTAPPLSQMTNHSVENEIKNFNSYKKDIILKEWILLKEMLELREKWKMKLLSPYARIRFITLEIAKRFNLGQDIFGFTFSEILNQDFDLKKAKKRMAHAELSKSIYLPNIIDLKNLESILTNKVVNNSKTILGESLSPGLVFGVVRVVTDPENTDINEWPDNVVLVAESTDPGWTGLFLKSKAVIVEKGGVLSHCAIVAREMNLPAISGIKQCHLRFKNGDKVWVDGNNGRVTLA